MFGLIPSVFSSSPAKIEGPKCRKDWERDVQNTMNKKPKKKEQKKLQIKEVWLDSFCFLLFPCQD
jgi:hypothetical protein